VSFIFEPTEGLIIVSTISTTLWGPRGRIEIHKLEALGKEQEHFPILGHTLPPGIAVDGLLGLDFLRGERLGVDFRTGSVTLE
jgi:hypothetical protein